ncbi:MAG: DUF86 domain-containing protein [Halothece sp.]
MSERSNREYLHHIQQASHRIASYTTGMTEQTFWEDSKTQDAVIRNLEIIGEATKNLTNEVRERYPEIPWKSMAALRDRLIHNYFGVNLDIVWQIVVQELPKVSSQLEIILNENNL